MIIFDLYLELPRVYTTLSQNWAMATQHVCVDYILNITKWSHLLLYLLWQCQPPLLLCCWFGLPLMGWATWQPAAADPLEQPAGSQPHPLPPEVREIPPWKREEERYHMYMYYQRGRCDYSATMICYHLNKLQSYLCIWPDDCTVSTIVCFVSLLFAVLLCHAIPVHVVTFLFRHRSAET